MARALSNAHGYVSVQNAAWTTLSVAKPFLERLTNTHRRRDTSLIRAHKRTAQQLQLRSCTAHAYVNATRKKPITYHPLDRAISTTGNFPAEPNIIFRKSKDRTSKNIKFGAYTPRANVAGQIGNRFSSAESAFSACSESDLLSQHYDDHTN